MTNTIVIAPAHLHYDLRLQYMRNSRSNSFAHVSYMTLSQYLDQFRSEPKINPTKQIVELYHIFTGFDAPIFAAMLQTPAFLQELQHVMNLLIENNVEISELPENTPSQKELRAILMKMRQTYQYSADQKMLAMAAALKQQDTSHLRLVNVSAANAAEQKFLEALVQKGAQQISHFHENMTIDYRFALNIRQEVEACAQRVVHLLQKGIPCDEIAIVVSDVKHYLPFIENVFSRYRIPYFFYGQSIHTTVKRYFFAAFEYYKKPSLSSFLHLIDHPLLNIPYISQLKQYVSLLSISFDNMNKVFDASKYLTESIHPHTRKTIIRLEVEAQLSQKEYAAFFSRINKESFSTIFISFYQHLVDIQQQLSADDMKYVQTVRSTFAPLLQSLDSLRKEVAFEMALEVLSSIQIDLPRHRPAISINDIKQPPLPVQHGFALGFYQDTYPDFHPLTGILDEAIVSALAGYESLAARFYRHIQTHKQNLQFAEHVVFSMPQGNFEGKEYESSLDLEMQFMLDKPKAWDIKENEYHNDIQHTLDPNLAAQLFIHNDELTGSISRVESYFKCPYSYYLKYGLALPEPVRFALEEAEIGQMYHGFLDYAVSLRKKEYVSIDRSLIQSYVAAALSPYKNIFKYEQALYQIIEMQLVEQIANQLTQLKPMEENTSFEPAKTEMAFDHELTKVNGVTVRLRGVIDRIDEIAHGFRIIDYKSSSRTLRIDDFLAGVSLQLITYSYIAATVMKKKPFGCYYVDLSQSSLQHTPFRIDRKKKEVTYYDESTYIQEFQRPKKLKGLTFINEVNDIVLLDNSQSMIQGLSCPKAGPKVESPVNFDVLSDSAIALYQELVGRILAGRIELKPVKNACTYCPYKIVCHYHGKPRKKKAVVNQATTEEQDMEVAP